MKLSPSQPCAMAIVEQLDKQVAAEDVGFKTIKSTANEHLY
jgi:hypothetical protein